MGRRTIRIDVTVIKGNLYRLLERDEVRIGYRNYAIKNLINAATSPYGSYRALMEILYSLNLKRDHIDSYLSTLAEISDHLRDIHTDSCASGYYMHRVLYYDTLSIIEVSLAITDPVVYFKRWASEHEDEINNLGLSKSFSRMIKDMEFDYDYKEETRDRNTDGYRY